MANEITFASSLSVTQSDRTSGQSVNGTATQTTEGAVQRPQTVNTTGAALTVTGLTASRWIQIKNTSNTGGNVVHVGPDSSGIVPLATLNLGEVMLFPRHASATVRVVANANTATISITALET